MARRNSADAELRARAEAVIPGGMYGHQSARLLPDDYPQFFSRAQGTRLWDADGAELIDLMCAYGPNLMGYGDHEIDDAFIAQLRIGDAMTGPTGLIVDLAETMTAMVTHADWAIFCKNGTDATSIALMTARAHTRRKTVIRAKGAYHGCAPWSTARTAGTIPEDKAHQILCDYNDVGSLEEAASRAGDDLAAIFAAPLKHDAFIDQEPPLAAYARRARELADETGALLVVDDVRAGLRIARDCSWSVVGVHPDLSTWGKCLANGHALSATLGSEKARRAAASIFVTGSFWFQAAPMAAALATLTRVRETDYLEQMQALGGYLRQGLSERAEARGIGLRQTGPSTMPLVLFDDDPDMRKGFFFGSEMLKAGVYFHPWHNMFLNAAMTRADIDQVLAAADRSLGSLKSALPALGPVEKMAFLAA
jgi:glutamate-1-semialdehyde 2,1-aminomutase